MSGWVDVGEEAGGSVQSPHGECARSVTRQAVADAGVKELTTEALNFDKLMVGWVGCFMAGIYMQRRHNLGTTLE